MSSTIIKKDFLSVISDITSQFNKIKKGDYLINGKYPIIDQGKEFIAGYTNEESYITVVEKPVIIFGDHTRVFKYIDFPIAIGADGVKVLDVKNGINSNYIYYYLRSIKIHDAGYSRHFKFLKDLKIPVPEKLEDQTRIAKILSRAETLIAKRKESIQLLDELLKSTFLDMFGDPVRNEKGFEVIKEIKDICQFKGGGTPSKSKAEYYTGDIPWVSPKDMKFLYITTSQDKITEKAIKESSTTLIEKGAVLMVVRSGILKSKLPVAINNVDITLNQDMKAFRSSEVISQYLLYYFISNERNILKKVRATTADNLNFEDIKSLKIIVPPITLQTQFAQIVEKVENIKTKYQESLQELENLYASLSQKAFKGELDLSKLEVEQERLDIAAEEGVGYGKTNKKKENNYFKRVVLAAEIVSQLYKEPTFGNVKFQKLVYLCEQLAEMDLHGKYEKRAAGPHDRKFMHSIDKEFKRLKWFSVNKENSGRYIFSPVSGLTKYKRYYTNYFANADNKIQELISIFRKSKSEKVELIATLFACWKDILNNNQLLFSNELLIKEFYKWSEEKQKFSKDQVEKAIVWMKENELYPR